jgi:predicted amidohydrolase YtcJ
MNHNADFILQNAILLTMDSELSIFEPGAIAIQGDHILAVGKENDICNQ